MFTTSGSGRHITTSGQPATLITYKAIAISEIRPAFAIDGWVSWNGTMAKLEVIRDVPDDEDGACLPSFPEKYSRPTGRNSIGRAWAWAALNTDAKPSERSNGK